MQHVNVAVLDVSPGLEPSAVVVVRVPMVCAPEHVVGAVDGEPAVGGGGAETGDVVVSRRQVGDAVEEGAAVAAHGAEGAIGEHDPWRLAMLQASGGVPCAANSSEAGDVSEGEVGEDLIHEFRQERDRTSCCCRGPAEAMPLSSDGNLASCYFLGRIRFFGIICLSHVTYVRNPDWPRHQFVIKTSKLKV